MKMFHVQVIFSGNQNKSNIIDFIILLFFKIVKLISGLKEFGCCSGLVQNLAAGCCNNAATDSKRFWLFS